MDENYFSNYKAHLIAGCHSDFKMPRLQSQPSGLGFSNAVVRSFRKTSASARMKKAEIESV
jgi:hypothetical protein